MAKEKLKAKEKAEEERVQEYSREQERWNNRLVLLLLFRQGCIGDG